MPKIIFSFCSRFHIFVLFNSTLVKKTVITLLVSLFYLSYSQAQKIDSDSLVRQVAHQLNVDKNYQKAIKSAQLGIRKAPDYLDFHLLLGSAYWQTKQIDSARYYFSHVIDRNPKYKEAYSSLAKLEIGAQESKNAIAVTEKALTFYPEEKEFYALKLDALRLQNNAMETQNYLLFLTKKFPDDVNFQQQLNEIKQESVSDRIGISYNYTTFSRDGIGPWHLTGLQYVRERIKSTITGRVNYADRRSFGQSINSGFQFEAETYLKHGAKNYSFANVALGDETVFPKLRLGYSYFQGFGKGWEADLGIRYTKTLEDDVYGGVLGIGNYFGNYWLNLKSYLQWGEDKIYPAFIGTARYYFDTKFDYVTVLAGYGTSPDERVTLGQFQQRISLQSYRIGAGYYRLFAKHYCTGIQGVYNRQEYFSDQYQNEFDLFLSLQYKF